MLLNIKIGEEFGTPAPGSRNHENSLITLRLLLSCVMLRKKSKLIFAKFHELSIAKWIS